MLDLSESGGDIAEKLFVLLDEKQQKELTSYVITRNIQDCSFSGSLPDVFNNSPAQADSIQTLTEIRDGDLYFCLEGRTVCIRDQEIDLTAKEFDALHLLIINRRRVLTFETIAYHVWDEDYMSRLSAMNSLLRYRNTGNRSARKAGRSPNAPIPRIFSRVRYSAPTVAGASTGNGRNVKKARIFTGSIASRTAVWRKIPAKA